MDVLVRAASADPNIRLHPGTALELVEQDSDAVRVVAGAEEYRGDLLQVLTVSGRWSEIRCLALMNRIYRQYSLGGAWLPQINCQKTLFDR